MEPAPRPRRVLPRVVLATLATVLVLEAIIALSFWSLGAGPDHLFGSWVAFSVLALPVSFVFGAVFSALLSGRAAPSDGA